MIILVDKPGQMGNQLWAYSPFIIYGLLNKRKILINGFEEHINFFPELKNESSITIVRNKLHRRLAKKISRSFLLKQKTSPRSSAELAAVLRWPICMIRTWGSYKPDHLLSEYPEITKRLFLPECNHSLKKEDKGIWIGIHMRQGDYLNWREGQFYYPEEYYKKKASQVKQELDREVNFFIASNSKPNHLARKLRNSHFLDNASHYDDMALLSQCDFILAPPSTFSRWAALVGRVPLILLDGLSDDALLQKAEIPSALLDIDNVLGKNPKPQGTIPR